MMMIGSSIRQKPWGKRLGKLGYLLFVYLVVGSFSTALLPSVLAQTESQWTPPERLSGEIIGLSGRPADSFAPTLVADSSGIVHAIWAARVDENTQGIGDTLYYSRWNGGVWSAPLDIFYSSQHIYWLPQAAVSQDDRIHLVWVSNRMVWYSRVAASEAAQVTAWSPPVQLSEQMASNASIAVAPDGSIHILYITLGRNKHIYHTGLSDGISWSTPVWIGDVVSDLNDAAPRLAIDELNRLHAVFGEMGSGAAVYYTQSTDNGQNWSFPFTVDARDEQRYSGGYGPAWINVITKGKDEIHLVWDGPPLGQRWHQWSDDGGRTWKSPVQLSSEVRGLTSTNAMAFDSKGRLHLFSMGVTGTGPYYSSWRNGIWEPMNPIARSGWDGEGQAMAISGNHVVVAWWNRSPDAIDIWSCTRKIDAPPIPKSEEPTVYPPTSTPLALSSNSPATPAPDVISTASPTLPVVVSSHQQTRVLPANLVLFIGSLPAVILAGGVFLFHRRSKRLS